MEQRRAGDNMTSNVFEDIKHILSSEQTITAQERGRLTLLALVSMNDNYNAQIEETNDKVALARGIADDNKKYIHGNGSPGILGEIRDIKKMNKITTWFISTAAAVMVVYLVTLIAKALFV